jgi:hypothetical protein
MIAWMSPGNLSARSIQLAQPSRQACRSRLQRMRGAKDGTMASSGQSSILIARSCRNAGRSRTSSGRRAGAGSRALWALVRSPWPSIKIRTDGELNQASHRIDDPHAWSGGKGLRLEPFALRQSNVAPTPFSRQDQDSFAAPCRLCNTPTYSIEDHFPPRCRRVAFDIYVIFTPTPTRSHRKVLPCCASKP